MILDFNKRKERKELIDSLIDAGEIMDKEEVKYYRMRQFDRFEAAYYKSIQEFWSKDNVSNQTSLKP